MHQQRSTKSLRSLRLGACHFLINIILAITGCGFLTTGIILNLKQWTVIGSITMAVWLLSILAFFILSYSWKCPLCMGRVWVKNGCRKHRKAVRSLGISYRLGVATSTIRGKPYRCLYCGEPFSTTKARH